jgi:GH15 family glucan-1,4-alpha-glucosidase
VQREGPTTDRRSDPRPRARIEEHALLGDTHSAALVTADGTVDWLCWPRFDSDALFAALLGEPRHGHWALGPAAPLRSVRRRYRPRTLVLETELSTDAGTVRLVDFMTPRDTRPDLVRIAEGVSGAVPMRLRLAPRFGYGRRRAWVRVDGHRVTFTSAPDALVFTTEVPVSVPTGNAGDVEGTFELRAGERAASVLAWHPAHEPPPPLLDPAKALADTEAWWVAWSGRCPYEGPWADEVATSRTVLKALTYAPTGGIVAAPTTSLPERLGGTRNWDYRYCWLRDATLTLQALGGAGCLDEALAWRDWLLRVARGDPRSLQVMYGVAGERRLPELELPWLPGHEGSAPVRIGNAAAGQLQLDVYGEVLDALHNACTLGATLHEDVWRLEIDLLAHLARCWREPDEGIWEVRGPRRHFTHSKVLCWVAFDRAAKDAVRFGLDGPVDRWRATADAIREDVLRNAWDPERRTFTQSYGSRALDASLLLVPTLGFLPADDPRVVGTIAAIERELLRGGFVHRYDTEVTDDGLPAGEGAFLACSFWLVDALVLCGRHDDATRMFERLVRVTNDVGLLAEMWDPAAGRQVGNFPQAFSHVALVNSALNLSRTRGPARMRGE